MTDWAPLIPEAPCDWALLPLDGHKRPVDMATGELFTNWAQHPGYDIEALSVGNGFVKAVVEEALDSAANNLYIARDQGSLLLHDSVHVKHVDPHIEQGYCGLCAKKLQPIKNQRRNGGMGSDWKSRRLHITCWRKLNESGF